MKKNHTTAMVFMILSLSVVLSLEAADNDSKRNSELNREITIVRNSDYFENLLIYVAARKGDVNLCPTDGCKSEARYMMSFRDMAAGKCERVGDPFIKDICQAQKTGKKERLSELEEKYLSALESDDIAALIEVEKNRVKEAKKESWTRAHVLHDAGVYWGYKHYHSQMACQNYTDKIEINPKAAPFYLHYACALLFYPDPDEALDVIVRDAALFNLSRKENNMRRCDEIKDQAVKKACRSLTFKTLADIFG